MSERERDVTHTDGTRRDAAGREPAASMWFPGEDEVPRVLRAADLLTYWARRQPGAPFDHLGDARRDYRTAAADVTACARALLASGMRPGDRVAVLSTPRPEFMTLFLALSTIGGVWVGLNPGATREEIAHVLADCEPVALFTLDRFADRDYAADIAAVRAEHPGLREVVAITGELPGAVTFPEVCARAVDGPAEPSLEVDPDGPALIIYTSGSTGRPKGAVISHRAFGAGCYLQGSRYYHRDSAVLANLPIDHVAGVMDLGCIPLAMGGCLHYQEDFDPVALLALIETERITMWGQVPTIFQIVTALPQFATTDLSSLRYVAWGGAPMPVELVARLRATGARLGTVYGLTESCVAVAYNDADADDEALASTIGRPDPRLDFRLAEASGQPVPDGTPGEVQLRNPSLMTGYLNLPEAGAGAFTDDGYLRTGDVGVRRPDGNVQLVGRLTEMFKSGGYNIHPREIESVVESHPDVEAAAVVEAPDPTYQEVGVCYLVTREGALPEPAELAEHCRESLARYKVPKRFFMVTELPRLSVGKIDRSRLRARARADTAQPVDTGRRK